MKGVKAAGRVKREADRHRQADRQTQTERQKARRSARRVFPAEFPADSRPTFRPTEERRFYLGLLSMVGSRERLNDFEGVRRELQ